MFRTCRVVDVELPYREEYALTPALLRLELFALVRAPSLLVEGAAGARRTTRGGSTPLARYCVHPNYFGDFSHFSAGTWPLALYAL